MEALFQIVGCVLSSKPAPELIDAFVAQVRRERGVVMVKSAQGATFVRFNAPDTRLVSLACSVARSQWPALLRFGFAAGIKEPTAAGQDGLDIGTRSVVQANDLAAGAGDGEVLVSPQLAVMLIEFGFDLRSRQVQLPGGRMVPACLLDLSGSEGDGSRPELRSSTELRAGDPSGQRSKAHVGGGPESTGLLWRSQDDAPSATPGRADALGSVFLALIAQAEEMARRQGELEARQDAVLAKMTLADEGKVSARHLAEMESELDAQIARVEARLDFIDKLEQRVGYLHRAAVDFERKLAELQPRRAEVENLKALCDALVAQMVDAQQRLDGVAAAQERLLPMAPKVETLTQALDESMRVISTFEGRLAELHHGTDAVEQKIESLAERDAMVQAVRAEVDQIREIGGLNRADLQFVADRRQDVDDLRAKVEDLLDRVVDTDGKIALIESRRKMVEELQSRTSTVTHMLSDIQVNLEMLGEQRAVIDHVGEKLARLDFTVQEAQNTLRALQREREVAERIEQSIKALRKHGGVSQTPG